MRSKVRICTDLNNLVNRISLNEMTLRQFSHISVSKHLEEEISVDQQKMENLINEYYESYGEKPQKRSCGRLYRWI